MICDWENNSFHNYIKCANTSLKCVWNSLINKLHNAHSN